ncbi:MAG TPA: cupin domain-containing protein [Thermoanaerobaculia bacterium]
MTLEQLIAPLSPAAFFADFWQRRPCLVDGADGRLAGLLSSRDVARLLYFGGIRAPQGMMLVKQGRHYDQSWARLDGTPHPEKVRAAWGAGYTIIVNALHRLWEPAAALVACLEEELHHAFNVNLYFSPPGSQGFNPHFDPMDVFILQLEGAKTWEIRERVPLASTTGDATAVPADRLPPVVLETELRAGSVLYLPRGFVHAARTTAAASLHLTVGVNLVTWADLMSAALAALRGDERWLEALPPAFLHGAPGMEARFRELAGELPRQLSFDGALARLGEQLISGKSPLAGDDLFQDKPELALDSVLTRREGMLVRVLEGPGYAGLQYPGGKLTGPAKIAPALHHVESHRRFSVASLPGELDGKEKMVLARRMVRDGLLAVDLTAAPVPAPGASPA